MADGTVATNNTTIAGKPQVRTNIVNDPASAETYLKQVTGGVDAACNGTIIVNGTSIDLKAGKGGASVGGTTYAVENFKKAQAGGWDTTGKVTATTVIAVNADTTEVTIFGKKYYANVSIVTQADLNDWTKKRNEAIQALVDAGTFTNTAKATNALDNAGLGDQAYSNGAKPTVGTTIALIDSNGKELTKTDLGVKDLDFTTNPGCITITEEYHLDKDGNVLDDEGNGVKIGTLNTSEGVSVSNAFQHGRRNLTFSDSITLQTGARSKDAVDFTFEYTTSGIGDLTADLDISSRGLGTAQLSLITAEKANEAIDHIDNAINKVSMVRATFGAIQNRLEHKIDNLTTTSTNLSEAESNIRDTDMANEMMNYTKYNILQQASQSMLAQANQQPQSILQLLG